MFPKGNNGKGAMSVYLNVPDSDTPPGWQRRAKFILILQNQIDSSKDIKRGVLLHQQQQKLHVLPALASRTADS